MTYSELKAKVKKDIENGVALHGYELEIAIDIELEELNKDVGKSDL